jgi:hypothetical protein
MKNIKGGDLKRSEGGVVLVMPPNMMHVLAHGGPVKRTSKIEDAGRRYWRYVDRTG